MRIDRRVAAVALAAMLLAGCSDDKPATAGDSKPAASKPAVSDLNAVTVEGAPDAKPTLKLDGRFVAASPQLTSRRITPGNGASVAGQVLRIDFTMFDGDSGQPLQSTYDQPGSYLYLTLDKAAKPAMAPYVDPMLGAGEVSRTLIAEKVKPATSAPTATGHTPDTVLYVLDVRKVLPGAAAGAPVKAPEGLPSVALSPLGEPTITMPKADPPKNLLVQPLKQGTGPQVQAGQTATMAYRGVKWSDGKTFDSTWTEREPRDFKLGVGELIKGWDVALVGQPVGSQVLIVVPPGDGYGEKGNPQAGISGTETLVFVVDILDTRTI